MVPGIHLGSISTTLRLSCSFVTLYQSVPPYTGPDFIPIEVVISEEGHEVVPGLFLEPGALPLWAGLLPHHTNWTQ